MAGVDVTTGDLAGATIGEQTRQALANCRAVLRAADAAWEDIAEVGVLLTNPADFAGMNEEYATWFPARRRRATSPSSASNCPAFSYRSA